MRSGKRLPRRAIALRHSRRPCAGSRKHRRPRFAMVENRSRRAPTPICVQRPTGPKSRGPATCLPRCAIAPRHSRRLCAAAGTLPPPFIDGRKSVPSTAHANMHTSIGVTGYRRSGKLPAPLCHRSPALSQTVRGHGDAAPTRRIALSRSARLGSSPILKSNYRRRSSTPCVRIRGCLRACVCGYTIGVGCPSFTLCQELNTNGRFERSMVENRSHLPSPRAERCAFFGWFAGCF